MCSIDKAEEIGLDWWKYDRHLSPGREQMMQENLELREQLRHGDPEKLGEDLAKLGEAGPRDLASDPRRSRRAAREALGAACYLGPVLDRKGAPAERSRLY